MSNIVKGVGAVSPFVLEDVQAKANQVLAQAREQAEAEAHDILEKAKAEARRIQEETKKGALEEGRREGLAQGSEEGRKQAVEAISGEWKQSRSALEQAVGALQASISEATLKSQEKVLAVTLAAAKAVVKRQVSVDERAFEGNLKAVLELCAKARKVRIQMNPEDLKLLQKGMEGLKPVLAGIESVEWIADAKTARGGVMARLESGEIDATMETLLTEMEQAVLGAGEKEEEGIQETGDRRQETQGGEA